MTNRALVHTGNLLIREDRLLTSGWTWFGLKNRQITLLEINVLDSSYTVALNFNVSTKVSLLGYISNPGAMMKDEMVVRKPMG
ncbi:hypothetical protein DPMN_096572 [Dreissena polymorpha]|uniref:Uncharacterized protein n=1 Tax=Dreissena polymorpha TaxID=45954 RepID=A0A9D4L8Z7_DREPO|nr:hypothetical protein DPMN_096572 [Dreissena polymorpha]